MRPSVLIDKENQNKDFIWSRASNIKWVGCKQTASDICNLSLSLAISLHVSSWQKRTNCFDIVYQQCHVTELIIKWLKPIVILNEGWLSSGSEPEPLIRLNPALANLAQPRTFKFNATLRLCNQRRTCVQSEQIQIFCACQLMMKIPDNEFQIRLGLG